MTKVIHKLITGLLFAAALPAFASISSPTASSGPFVISSSPQTIPVGFAFNKGSELLVSDQGSTGSPRNVTLALGSDYTVTGGGYNSPGQMQTGSIIVVSAGSHSVVSGDNIYISRNVPLTQTTSLLSGGPLTLSAIEQALDKVTTEVQMVSNPYYPINTTIPALTVTGTATMGTAAVTGTMTANIVTTEDLFLHATGSGYQFQLIGNYVSPNQIYMIANHYNGGAGNNYDYAAMTGGSPMILMSILASPGESLNAGDLTFYTSTSVTAGSAIAWSKQLQLSSVNGVATFFEPIYVLGNIGTAAAGETLSITTGGTNNSKAGAVQLSSGTATVSNNTVTTHSVIHVAVQPGGGSVTAAPYVSSATASTGFTVKAGGSDTAFINWWIEENN